MPPVGEQPLSPSDERTFAMLGHLGGILIGFLSGLIAMLVWGKRSAFVDDQAKEALNFQITLIIGYVIAFVLTFVFIGVFLYFALAIVNVVFCIIAGLAANKGETYRYPFALRLVK
jgi:uncharacterized Tic20 family protein